MADRLTKKDLDSVEESLKKESPNAYPFMIGTSPVTHLRRYLKKKQLANADRMTTKDVDTATSAGEFLQGTMDPGEQSGEAFGKAFKEARQKGEGTKFKYNEKDYSAVTKEDISKSGKSTLGEYLNKAKGGMIMSRGCKMGRNKPTKLY